MLEPDHEKMSIGSFIGSFGPGLVDQRIREAILFCWGSIPEQHRSLDKVEQEINRIVKRAFDNFREDLDILNSFIT